MAYNSQTSDLPALPGNGDWALRVVGGVGSWVRTPAFQSVTATTIDGFMLRDAANVNRSVAALDVLVGPTTIVFGEDSIKIPGALTNEFRADIHQTAGNGNFDNSISAFGVVASFFVANNGSYTAVNSDFRLEDNSSNFYNVAKLDNFAAPSEIDYGDINENINTVLDGLAVNVVTMSEFSAQAQFNGTVLFEDIDVEFVGNANSQSFVFGNAGGGGATLKFGANAGSPEGSVTGDPGAIISDKTNGNLYIKHTGVGTNTGWKLVTLT